MVLLTAGLRPANPREIKLQCLEGWHGLVKALAADAPVELGGVVNQVGPGVHLAEVLLAEVLLAEVLLAGSPSCLPRAEHLLGPARNACSSS